MSETPGPRPEPKPIAPVATKAPGAERPHHPHGLIGRAEKFLRSLTHQEARKATPLEEIKPPLVLKEEKLAEKEGYDTTPSPQSSKEVHTDRTNRGTVNEDAGDDYTSD